MEAAEYYASLKANAEAYSAGLITYEAFGRKQFRTWDAIDSAGLTDEVLALIRGRMTPDHSGGQHAH